eukprot:6278862-Pyramimonas_sp.AAC.1
MRGTKVQNASYQRCEHPGGSRGGLQGVYRGSTGGLQGVYSFGSERDVLRDICALSEKLSRRVETVEGMLEEHALSSAADLEDRLAQLNRKANLANRAKVQRSSRRKGINCTLEC